MDFALLLFTLLYFPAGYSESVSEGLGGGGRGFVIVLVPKLAYRYIQ